MVYENYSREERRRILPIAFHGDKGRGYQKAPVFIFDWETVFALPEKFRRAGSKSKREIADQKRKVYGGRLTWTCSQRAAECGKHCSEPAVLEGHCTVGSAETPLLEAMGHNGKGNSLFSRYLVACIPKKVLSQNDAIVPTLLTEVAQNLQSLFFTGIQDRDGVTYRAAFIGCKGDFEFLQLDAGSFQRTYLNEGRVHHHEMCPECWAGRPEYPTTDMADRPKWVDSLYKDDPWSTEPPLNLAPYASTCTSSLYKRDCFHMLKYGFARDLCGSILFLLSWLQYFDFEGVQSRSIDVRLGPGAQPFYHVVHGRTQVFHDKAIYAFQLTSQEVLAFSVARWKGVGHRVGHDVFRFLCASVFAVGARPKPSSFAAGHASNSFVAGLTS